MLANSCESSAIDFRDANIGVDQRLGHMCPYRFGAFAVAAPWCIEHNEPLTLMTNVNETVA